MELSEKSTNNYTPAAWASKPAPKKGGFANFLWNPDTREFCGRTGSSWGKITLFYLIFYACLALFFMTSLQIFMTTLEDDKPRWQLAESIIGTNPGVGFRPMPDQDKNTDSSLIWVNRQTEKTKSYWVDELNAFLTDYDDSTAQLCSFNDFNLSEKKKDGEACKVPVDDLKFCNSANGFGYVSGGKGAKFQPCVLVKLNKIYGWRPEPYDTMELLDVAKERGMPADLVKRITDLIKLADAGDMVSKNKLKTIWISCEGENPADIENIGKMKYHAPGILGGEFPGIPGYYFPYLMQDDYQSPFVFVQFENVSPHTLVNVRCTAWAHNIKADTQARAGLVHFEFLID